MRAFYHDSFQYVFVLGRNPTISRTWRPYICFQTQRNQRYPDDGIPTSYEQSAIIDAGVSIILQKKEKQKRPQIGRSLNGVREGSSTGRSCGARPESLTEDTDELFTGYPVLLPDCLERFLDTDHVLVTELQPHPYAELGGVRASQRLLYPLFEDAHVVPVPEFAADLIGYDVSFHLLRGQ
jgi:hypothetical protein